MFRRFASTVLDLHGEAIGPCMSGQNGERQRKSPVKGLDGCVKRGGSGNWRWLRGDNRRVRICAPTGQADTQEKQKIARQPPVAWLRPSPRDLRIGFAKYRTH